MVTGAGGDVVAAAGDIDRVFFLRSAAKPFQAFVSVEAGARLDPVHLAVAAASHRGDPVHVALVRAILERAGLRPEALRCPPARPHPAADRRLAATGDVEPAPIHHNCSGKHAAMLAACVASGWDTDAYLEPDHPLHVRVGRLLGEVSGMDPGPSGVDGCGVPVWRTTVRAMGRSFAVLATDPRFAGVRSAMSAYPALVGGEGRPDTLIGRWLGAPVKAGAAGCMGAAVSGFGVAAKAWSGHAGVAGMGVVAGLAHLGVVTRAVEAGLRDVVEVPVFGGGREVGRYRLDSVLESV